MRIFDAADIRETITMREVIDAMRGAFIALSEGRATVPLRGVMPVGDNITLTMPAHIAGDAISTVKVVSVYPGNRAQNLPVVNGVVLVLDAQTGVPRALMDGASLTALRTGAASGLATELLARPDASVLGVIGAGAQARTQIEAVCAVREISEIRVYSPHHAQQLVDEIQWVYDAEVRAATGPHEALDGADIIVAATNSKTPVVHRVDVKPGAHINGIGSFTPAMQEVAADVVTGAKIVVDHRESVWAEAGDLIIPRDQGLISARDIHAELGELAAGKRPGRESPDEITFFKSVGNAVQDTAAASLILRKRAD